jgi:hypothetical protein
MVGKKKCGCANNGVVIWPKLTELELTELELTELWLNPEWFGL